MRKSWKQGITVLALVAAVGLWCYSPAAAKKPGGGGGGGDAYPPPTGTLYYEILGLYEISPDGTQSHELPVGIYGQASQVLHNGRRWFLRLHVETLADGTLDTSLIAARENGANPPIEVTLFHDAALRLDGGTAWSSLGGVKDAMVSFVASGWDNALGRNVSDALYLAPINFDANGEVQGLLAPPELVLEGVGDYGWSPNGSAVVFSEPGVSSDLYIYDCVAHGVSPLLVTGSLPAAPQWSTDGTRVGFRTLDHDAGTTEIRLINVDFDPVLGLWTGAKERVVASESTSTSGTLRGSGIDTGPFWSPDSGYLVYAMYGKKGYEVDWSLVRIRDDGSHPTTLLHDRTVATIWAVGWTE